MLAVQVQYWSMRENIRHNKKTESIGVYEMHTNRINARINAQNAVSNRIQARASQSQAKSARMNAQTNKVFASAAVTQAQAAMSQAGAAWQQANAASMNASTNRINAITNKGQLHYNAQDTRNRTELVPSQKFGNYLGGAASVVSSISSLARFVK